MSLLPITIYGEEILRKKAKEITAIDDELITLVKDMFDTMRNANGIGLAANQVNLDKQIFIVDISPVEGYEKVKPLIAINPKIIASSNETEPFEEGCLSLPTLRADVFRPAAIKLRYLDLNEEEQEIEADGLLARVFQHESDHLIGKLIPDRIDNKSKKKLSNVLDSLLKRQIETDYPIFIK
ncbi:MAG: peptide deformylase [Ignavibacteriales bacterium]|nr:peptide deformylase [Ignavibacteriales bacterium]